MEQRVARLETHVEHIQSDVSEIKVDIRRLDAKVDGLGIRLDGKIDSLRDSVAALALSTERGFAGLTRWGIGLYIALVAGLATGFMWLIQRLP